MSKTRVVRCSRCKRRMRNSDGWTVAWVAGVPTENICPDCQSVAEDLEAELNEIQGHLKPGRVLFAPGISQAQYDADLGDFITALLRTYPTAQQMRAAADKLAALGQDKEAQVYAMRTVAEHLDAQEARP